MYKYSILISRVSRSSLFDSNTPDEEVYVPDLDSEIVQVDTEEVQNDENPQEFDFPLFSFGAAPVQEERGRTIAQAKVTLREASEERINNERPSSYYFAQYDDDEKTQFDLSAVTGQDILNQVNMTRAYKDIFSHRILDVGEYNKRIDRETQAPKRKRPGKNQRKSKIESQIRQKQRRQVYRLLEEEKERKLMKKRFHKRGGKKNKKKTVDV